MPGKRSAGILMHITSLPSRFGIGDLGQEAFDFADFLSRTHQRYWQLLPLNPIVGSQGFSPYSPLSSMAGNSLVISPGQLAREGLLPRPYLRQLEHRGSEKVDYERVVNAKEEMLEHSWHRRGRKLSTAFGDFCHREAYWLDDFALYMCLRKSFSDRPWHQWPDDFRLRKLKSLVSYARGHGEALDKVKWSQFLFFRQWKSLKAYCRKLKIRLIGDLPFYISYDSADVWSRREIFGLKKDGSIAGMAGVPPDYFNRKGQLWGMPVFRWDVLKARRYDWWVKRIRKNLELFDKLRLDHFRAFADYWEVPAGETSAVNGKWRKGPGSAIFSILKREFSALPFIAEDLGDINAEVHRLRDRFGLPGMKVLQFAFGPELAGSDHAPHNFGKNFVAYTGTHDNNTTRGWYLKELKKDSREQIEHYAGHSVDETNIHRFLARLAHASVAQTVILPMQDLLGLKAEARMNTPASAKGNWLWRMENRVPKKTEKLLLQWTALYGRDRWR